jgi:hypothetical protein
MSMSSRLAVGPTRLSCRGLGTSPAVILLACISLAGCGSPSSSTNSSTSGPNATLAAQLKFNLTKEVLDKKAAIVWTNALANTFSGDVCNIIQACGGAIKITSMPPTTEKGVKVARGLLLATSSDTNRTGDVIVLERQTPTDAAFYLVGPDGALVRVAYLDEGAPVKRWVALGAALEESQYETEANSWHQQVMQLGAPAKQE